MMDTGKIRVWTAEIESCERAVGWFNDYGQNAIDDLSVIPKIYNASACPGHSEAISILSELLAPKDKLDVLVNAITLAHNKIAYLKAQIIEEVSKSNESPDL